MVKAPSQLPLWKKKTARIITPTVAPPAQTSTFNYINCCSIYTSACIYVCAISRCKINRELAFDIRRVFRFRACTYGGVTEKRGGGRRSSCSRPTLLYSTRQRTRSGRYCRAEIYFDRSRPVKKIVKRVTSNKPISSFQLYEKLGHFHLAHVLVKYARFAS